MRVAIIGVGGVGTVLATELRADKRVDALRLCDKDPAQLRAFPRGRSGSEVDTRQLDAIKTAEVAKGIRGYDIVVNTSFPDYNFTIMKAALAEGVNYLDVASTGPKRPGGLAGILEQIGYHEAFRAAGITGLLSMGLDPGISNVMAREAADRLDSVDSVRIRSGGTLKIRDGDNLPRFVPLYSRDAFFSDMRIPPTVWEDGKLLYREMLAEEEEYAFPHPVGPQKTFLVAHEEVKTIPRYLGKPVRRVDFKYAVNPDLAQVLPALERLRLMAENRTIRLANHRITFREAFEAAFPEPAQVARRLAGVKCLSVDVDGMRNGTRMRIHSHISLSHQEAIRRRKTTAVYYLTGTAAAVGVGLLGEGALPGKGVYPSEVLSPERVFADWEAHDLPIERTESAMPN